MTMKRKPGLKPTSIRPATTPAYLRFWRRVLLDDGCWEWQGAHDKDGYGCFSVTAKESWRAHRYAYEFLRGPIPDGLVIDHLCKNRGCVNPGHMEPVEPGENVRRGDGPGHLVRRAGVCQRGHVIDENNMAASRTGRRRCRICQRANNAIRAREYRRIKREARAARGAA